MVARTALSLLVITGVMVTQPMPARSLQGEAPKAASARTLTQALQALQAQGLKVLFTSEVVQPEMRVLVEPTATSPEQILEQLLAPHGLTVQSTSGGTWVVIPRPATVVTATLRGQVRDRNRQQALAHVQILIAGTGLSAVTGADGTFTLPAVPPGTYTLEAHRPGFVVERLDGIVVLAGLTRELVLTLVPAPLPLDEIIVSPSVISLLRDDPVAVLALEREEILSLPTLGGDFFRALTLLPGTSGNELSAEVHIRGGRADEVLVLLDQLELFEPYHLRDFSNALSIITPRAIGEVDLILGSFPARFGDRMGGVLDMRTVAAGWEHPRHLGLSALSAQAGGASRFAGERGRFFGVARYGSLELASKFLTEEEQPRFWDAFLKTEYQVNAAHALGLRLLHSEDRLDFAIQEGADHEQAKTKYGGSNLWCSHQALLTPHLFVDSVLSRGRMDRNRQAFERDGEGQGFELRDERLLVTWGVKQDWNSQLNDQHYLRWGWDLRRLTTDYDYLNLRTFEDPLADLREEPRATTTAFRERLRSDQAGVYASDRWRPWSGLILELGLRYDEQQISNDQDLSPRFNLVLALGARSSLRAAWGHYFQSQRPYELQVEDGLTRFFPAERSEQSVLGFEHVGASGTRLRCDWYHRAIDRPRPRFENIFEPFSPFPEIEADRFRFTPEHSRAEGVELSLRSRQGRKLSWFLNYTYARIRDEIHGRKVPRGVDQPHALNADLHYQVSARWTLNLAFRYHTGWPTTAISGRLQADEEGELEPVAEFGPVNGARLPDYHRLDVRVTREWRLKKGLLTLFLDLQNLYNRRNIAGFDLDFDLLVLPDGRVAVTPAEERWGGLLPSLGIDWEF